MKGHNFGGICRKCGKTHVHPRGMFGRKSTASTLFKPGFIPWNKGRETIPKMREILANVSPDQKRENLRLHNEAVLGRLSELTSKGIQVVWVDLPGHSKPDIIYIENGQIMKEDIKTTHGKVRKVEKE